jgi:hypothetical protein
MKPLNSKIITNLSTEEKQNIIKHSESFGLSLQEFSRSALNGFCNLIDIYGLPFFSYCHHKIIFENNKNKSNRRLKNEKENKKTKR